MPIQTCSRVTHDWYYQCDSVVKGAKVLVVEAFGGTNAANSGIEEYGKVVGEVAGDGLEH